MTPPKLRIFPAIPRNSDSTKYVDELMRIARFSDLNGFAGVLLFTGNDVFVEPWSMAQHILTHTSKSSPLIAVNPIYMHPFTVAKFVSSFALLYRRKIYLNMVTGTATSDLAGLGEQRTHRERYSRLGGGTPILRQALRPTRTGPFRGAIYAAGTQ